MPTGATKPAPETLFKITIASKDGQTTLTSAADFGTYPPVVTTFQDQPDGVDCKRMLPSIMPRNLVWHAKPFEMDPLPSRLRMQAGGIDKRPWDHTLGGKPHELRTRHPSDVSSHLREAAAEIDRLSAMMVRPSLAAENAKLKAENAELREGIDLLHDQIDVVASDLRAAAAEVEWQRKRTISMPMPFHADGLAETLPHAGRYIAECVANHAAMHLRKEGNRVELPARIDVDAAGRMHAWATVQFMHPGEAPRDVDLLALAGRRFGHDAISKAMNAVATGQTPAPPDPCEGPASSRPHTTAGPDDTKALRAMGDRPLTTADDGARFDFDEEP
jgi:hypothetical protein